MFILIPLAVIIASLLGITAIVWRKKSYLNKLYSLNMAGSGTEAAVLNGSSFGWVSYGAEFFPEIESFLKKIKLHEYKALWLVEAEKLLRRTRLLFLRVDRLSDSLIKKIRRVHVNGQLNGHSADQIIEDKKTTAVPVNSRKKSVNPAFLKNEESRMIMEIAKNPKDGKLYEALGDLYVKMENWTDAKESYEASAELDPHNISLKEKLSSVLEKIVSK